MTRDRIQEETMTFHRVDKDNTGSITWWEFINFETTQILQQRHKVSNLNTNYNMFCNFTCLYGYRYICFILVQQIQNTKI